MKINPIMFYSVDFPISSTKTTNEKESLKQSQLVSYPKEYYLSFKGNSSELSKTISQLQQKRENFPPDIEKMALAEISAGNPKNKQLVDIHKEKYRELNDCDSLEELKFFFPEFAGVKSIDEDKIFYNKGSLIDKFMKGEIKTKTGELFLNPQKDLSLQLVQMYWGDCLSLNDITDACGHNFSATMQKLGIPTFTPVYGQYLKLSDEDARKAITEAATHNRSLNENSIKRKGIPLTEEHKRKISEGLRKYYKEHPNINFGQTEETNGYFARNPYQSEVFSQILRRAWNYHDSKSIKKALAKHMRKQDGEINEEILKNPAQALTLKDFWDKNQWAKEKWSVSMTKSWGRQKVLEEMGLIYEPKKFFPIMGKDFTKKLAEALKATNSDFADFEIKDIKDLLSLSIPDGRDSKQYNAAAMRNILEGLAPTIIKLNLDTPCYLIPTILDDIFKNQIERSQKIEYLASDSQKTVNRIIELRKSIDNKLIEEYKENKTPENLLKLFDMYTNLSIMCLSDDYPEIKQIYETTCDQCMEKRSGVLSDDFKTAIDNLDVAATKRSALISKKYMA